MTALVCVRVDTLPGCTGVADIPYAIMGVAELLSIFTGVMETLSDSNRMTGTPPTPDNNRSGVVTAPEKETREVVGSIMVRSFLLRCNLIV